MSMVVWNVPDSLADKYRGAGLAMAAVCGGQMVDLVYLEDAIPGFDQDAYDSPEAAVRAVSLDRGLSPTVRRFQALGQVSIGMCSCWEFCEL